MFWNPRYLYGQWTDFDDQHTKRKSFSCSTQAYEKNQRHIVLPCRKRGLDRFNKNRKSRNLKISKIDDFEDLGLQGPFGGVKGDMADMKVEVALYQFIKT